MKKSSKHLVDSSKDSESVSVQPALLLPPNFRVQRIISGGQTGVDRAGLDAAIHLGIEHGGWCPLGRRAEDGPIPDHYQLVELDSPNYSDRTRQNVLDSDGTLILYGGRLQGGTLLTARYAIQLDKPCLKIRLSGRVSCEQLISWIETYRISILNIAGPRASSDPKIYAKAYRYIVKTLA
jgi:hypothetical protein